MRKKTSSPIAGGRSRAESVSIARRSSMGSTIKSNSSRTKDDFILASTSCPEPKRNGLRLDDDDDAGSESSRSNVAFSGKNDLSWEERRSCRKREQRRVSPDLEGTNGQDNFLSSPPLAGADSIRTLSRTPSSKSDNGGGGWSTPPPGLSGKRKNSARKWTTPTNESVAIRQHSDSPDEVADWNADYRARLLRATPPPSNPSTDFSKRTIGERWKGRLDYPNKGFYVGDLMKDETGLVIRDGIGTAYDPIKSKIFEGTFIGDLKSGYGVTRYSDKVHQGSYEQGLRHGHGVFLFANGEKYEGEFYRGEFHGKGKMKWKDGTLFEGTFRKGKIRRGVKRWIEKGESYEGSFDEKGARTGFGTTRFANGDFHRGFYLNGLAHGRGEQFNRSQATTTYVDYVHGVPEMNSRFVITRGSRAKFAGELSSSELDAEWGPNSIGNRSCVGIMLECFGRLEGVEEDDDMIDVEDHDRVSMQQGTFANPLKCFPPRLTQGTYTTGRSRVTAQHFSEGPLVREGGGATWHDIETGNARWAKLGSRGAGPLGKALFVFANGAARARLETYSEEGALSESRNL